MLKNKKIMLAAALPILLLAAYTHDQAEEARPEDEGAGDHLRDATVVSS